MRAKTLLLWHTLKAENVLVAKPERASRPPHAHFTASLAPASLKQRKTSY
jgi:hypothetical protein